MLRTVIAMALVLVTSPAVAQPSPSSSHGARLMLTAPAACPQEQVLRDLIASQTSSDVLRAEASARLTVAVSRVGTRYQATVELRDAAGQLLWARPFDAVSSCSGLTQEIALVISATLDPSGKLAPVAASPLAEVPTTPPPPPPEERHAMTDPLLLVFGLGSTLTFGSALRPAAGLFADVGLHWELDAAPIDGFSLTLGGRWDPPASAALTAQPVGAYLSVSRLMATVAPCAHWWKLYGCALGELGQLQHQSERIVLPAGSKDLAAAAGARIGIEVPFAPHIGIRAFGEVLGTLTPVTVLIDERPVWETPLVSGGFGAGLYVFF